MDFLQCYSAGMEAVWMVHRLGQLIHQNSDKNVAQALTQLYILIIRSKVMCIMHNPDDLPELCAQGNLGSTELLLFA